MRDFTLNVYKTLLTTITAQGYSFCTFSTYLENSIMKNQPNGSLKQRSPIEVLQTKVLILRHDVDRLPQNALATAKIEHEIGIKGTYYFRIVDCSFDENIIRQIAELGHEIGYHYEDVDLTVRNRKSAVHSRQSAIESNTLIKEFQQTANNLPPSAIIDAAYELFKINLEKMKNVVDIKTICMHGSPLSKYDNKSLWTKYDYRELGIIGEPYLDLDWNEFGYLTDTGRRWDGNKVNIRDRIVNSQSAIGSGYSQSLSSNIQYPTKWQAATSIQHPTFRSTFDIIDNVDELPNKLMITVHPERWTDNWFLWSKQLIWQNAKNLVKTFVVKY